MLARRFVQSRVVRSIRLQVRCIVIDQDVPLPSGAGHCAEEESGREEYVRTQSLLTLAQPLHFRRLLLRLGQNIGPGAPHLSSADWMEPHVETDALRLLIAIPLLGSAGYLALELAKRIISAVRRDEQENRPDLHR